MRQHYQKELESRLVIPTLQFLHRERSSGIVLGIFVLLALVLANSPFREAYTHFLEHHFGFSINGQTYLDFSLEHWINDGLMSMFFFVVGLELKREFIGGELRDLRKVTLPVVAALCGMLFPAAIYLIFNAGAATSHGWGIPMATDIAFALAVLQLLGNRVPMSAKVFLTTLAIVDDLGRLVLYHRDIICQLGHWLCSAHRYVCWQPFGRKKRVVLWCFGYWWRVGGLPNVGRSCHNFGCFGGHGYSCRRPNTRSGFPCAY